MNLGDAIADRITELCDKQGISINRLAVLSGLTQSTVDGILKGRSRNPQLTTLIRIANGFGLTVAELLNDKRIDNADIKE